MNAIYASSFQGVADGKNAQLYVFAAGAQAGEGDLTINDNLYTDIWKGTSQSVDVFETSVEPGDLAVQFFLCIYSSIRYISPSYLMAIFLPLRI